MVHYTLWIFSADDYETGAVRMPMAGQYGTYRVEG